MYQQGDKMLEVRELLVKAFATAWKNSDQSTDRDTYINSSITVIDSMQVQPEMIYAEEGQGLTDGDVGEIWTTWQTWCVPMAPGCITAFRRRTFLLLPGCRMPKQLKLRLPPCVRKAIVWPAA